jgi:hypothetical protein
LTLFIYFSSFLIGLWNFFYFIFMGLSRSYDSSHEFSWLTWVDLIYYLGSFFNWMFFFSISPSNNSIVLFHVFFLQFHPSILSCLGIRFWNFFFNLVFVELTRSNIFNFFFLILIFYIGSVRKWIFVIFYLIFLKLSQSYDLGHELNILA